MLQLEDEPKNVSTNVIISDEVPAVLAHNCYVNDAFEDGSQERDKVNDNNADIND